MTGLAGRRALITGASRGIGAEIAAALAEQGCHVALNARHESDDLTAALERCRSHGVTAVAALGDVATEDGVRAAVTRVLDEPGLAPALTTAARERLPEVAARRMVRRLESLYAEVLG